MTKEKHIEEMARLICNCYDKGICSLDHKTCDLQCGSVIRAETLYENSYRKASEVAREIFEEIEKFNRPPLPECEPVYIIKASELAELKKKYTESEKDNGR